MNSEKQHRIRFSDADWYNTDFDVTVGGAGSIGSWLLLFLSRIGYSIYLYEMDIVDETNMGGQFYSKDDFGKTKQESIRAAIAKYALHQDIESMGEYKPGSMVSNIVFSCFDNMEARKNMFEQWKESHDSEDISVFVDGRLTAESFQMYIVTPERIEAYEKTLFDDGDIEDLPCSYKSTSHIAAMLASQMTNAMTNAVSNYIAGFDIRDLPFETRYEASMYLYEQKFKPDEEDNG